MPARIDFQPESLQIDFHPEPAEDRPQRPLRLKPWKFATGLVLIGLVYTARVYWEVRTDLVERERKILAIEPEMNIRELGYIASAKTSLDFSDRRYYTEILFWVPFRPDSPTRRDRTGDVATYSCDWESGGRAFTNGEAVYFIHSSDWSESFGYGISILRHVKAIKPTLTECWVFGPNAAHWVP